MQDPKNKKQDKPKTRKVETPKTTESKVKKVWFRRWWGIILAIIFLFPFGLYYIWHLWRKKDWSKKKKAGITTAILIPYLICILGLVAGWGTPSMSNYTEITNKPQFKIVGYTAWSKAKVEIDLNSTKVQESEINGGNFEKDVTLKEGNNDILLKATNEKGETKSQSYTITLDTVAPNLELSDSKIETDKNKLDIKGKTEKDTKVKLIKDNKEIAKLNNIDGYFTFKNVSVSEGENRFKVVTVDRAGNEQSKELTVKYTPPKKEEPKKEEPKKAEQPASQVKTKSMQDKLWEAFDSSIKNRDGYEVSFDDKRKTAILVRNKADYWDETNLVQKGYNNFIDYGMAVFRIDGVESVEVTLKENFTDVYGNNKTEVALQMAIKKDVFNQYHWENLKFQPIYEKVALICSYFEIHPAIYKKLKKDKVEYTGIN